MIFSKSLYYMFRLKKILKHGIIRDKEDPTYWKTV